MPVPNLKISRRLVSLYYILDISGSMNDNGKIQSLNQSLRQSLPEIKRTAKDQAYVEIVVKVVIFDNTAKWHTPQRGVPIEDFIWTDVAASNGKTSMGAALDLVLEDLEKSMPFRSCPPVLVLISDGEATDDLQGSVKRLSESSWGSKAIRIAIGMGPDKDIQWDALKLFMFDMEVEPLLAMNSRDLVRYITFFSTQGIDIASRGNSDKPKPSPTRVPYWELPTETIPWVDPEEDVKSDIW